MKYMMIAIAMLGATATTTAFAQTAGANTAGPATRVAQADPSVQQAGQWVAPYGQPVAQKTRAQVYNELVQAEKDGQLAYLNSTVYAHP